jgi:hypothetical protein
MISAFFGAFAANIFTLQREQQQRIKDLMQNVDRAAFDHKEALIWCFWTARHFSGIGRVGETISSERQQKNDKKLAAANSKRSKTYANMLYWESALNIQLGDTGQIQPLLKSLGELREFAVNPAEETFIAHGLIDEKWQIVAREAKQLIKKTSPRTLGQIVGKLWRDFDEATKLPEA